MRELYSRQLQRTSVVCGTIATLFSNIIVQKLPLYHHLGALFVLTSRVFALQLFNTRMINTTSSLPINIARYIRPHGHSGHEVSACLSTYECSSLESSKFMYGK